MDNLLPERDLARLILQQELLDPNTELLVPYLLCVSLNHALANASLNSAGFSKKCLEIFSYIGSTLKDKSVVNIKGWCFLKDHARLEAVPAPASAFWFPLVAPAGLLVNSHSKQINFEVVIAPFCWCGCPRTFKTAGNGITSITCSSKYSSNLALALQ